MTRYDQHDDPVSKWLTIERIGTSQFMEFVAFQNSPFWNARPEDDMATWTFQTLQLFTCGECYSLAAAIAVEAELPVLILRCKADKHPTRIAHAGIFDATSGTVIDILGRRLATDFIDELRTAVGDLKIELTLPSTDDNDEQEQETLARIGAALPWMPRHPSRPRTEFHELYRLIATYHAETPAHSEIAP